MKRRTIGWLVLLVGLLSISASARAAVEGTWTMGGRATVMVKVQGSPAHRDHQYASDLFTFHPGGAFTMVDASGSWTQTRLNFNVTLNAADIEALYEQMFADEGYTVDVTVTSLVLKGRETPSGERLRGKMTMRLELYIYYAGLPGKVKASYTFTGTRQAPGPAPLAASLPQALSLREAIGKSVVETIRQLAADR